MIQVSKEPLNSDSPSIWVCLISGLVAFTLGFGINPIIFSFTLIILLGGFIAWSQGLDRSSQKIVLCLTSPGFLIFSALLILFLACYKGFYIPYHPNLFQMPGAYFRALLTLIILTLICIICLDDLRQLIDFIWFFCAGTLLFCLLTVGASLLVDLPPYYSRVIDIRYLMLGTKKYINTPGISNLLCLFPAAFLGGLLLNSAQRPKFFWSIGILGFALSIGAAIVIGQRSYFALTLVIEPVLIGVFLVLLKKWWSLLATFCILISYPALREFDRLMGWNFIFRPLNQDLLNDARFQMLRFWLDHLLVDPFQRVDVGPPPWDVYPWFHNFFADLHRLSGFWALFTAVILVACIFIRICFVIKRDKRMGLFLMSIAIPCFLIMNTSVVPEGERQPFLLLLAIGAISEVILSHKVFPPRALPTSLKTLRAYQ